MPNIIIKRELVCDDLYTLVTTYRFVPHACGFITSSKDFKNNDYANFHRLYYLVHGKVSYTLNNISHEVDKNASIYLPPNHSIQFTHLSDEEPTALMFIAFRVDNLDKQEEFLQLMLNIFADTVFYDSHGKLYSFYTSIYNEGINEHFGHFSIINNLLNIILINMLRLSGEDSYKNISNAISTKKSNPIISKATHYIHNNIKENIKISELAKDLNISEIYLYKLFKEHLGKSPQQFLNDYRIQKAKEYLVGKYHSIMTISDELGYSSSNHFSKAFKNATGLSPNQWRSQIKNNK